MIGLVFWNDEKLILLVYLFAMVLISEYAVAA
uniref:Uncharacterized protein n=1 Tax=Rhizophora mucronata TaxID=61149 RepID=A0A2P2PNV0_RHIMU